MIRLLRRLAASIPTPPAGYGWLFWDDTTGEPSIKDESGTVFSLKGEQGDAGPTGATGPAGATGADGAAGPQGDPGPAGATGPAGADGVDGTNGADGADGVGVPAGGTTGQVLAKIDGTDHNTEWIDQASGGGIPEAPTDGLLYGRSLEGWEPVPIDGGVRERGAAIQSGGTLTIDMQGGLVRDFAASAPGANITAITITNPPASGKEFRFSIRIANVGAYTFTKPGNWSPVGQSDTAFTASKAHLIEAVSYDDGTTILFSMQEIP